MVVFRPMEDCRDVYVLCTVTCAFDTEQFIDVIFTLFTQRPQTIVSTLHRIEHLTPILSFFYARISFLYRRYVPQSRSTNPKAATSSPRLTLYFPCPSQGY